MHIDTDQLWLLLGAAGGSPSWLLLLLFVGAALESFCCWRREYLPYAWSHFIPELPLSLVCVQSAVSPGPKGHRCSRISRWECVGAICVMPLAKKVQVLDFLTASSLQSWTDKVKNRQKSGWRLNFSLSPICAVENVIKNKWSAVFRVKNQILFNVVASVRGRQEGGRLIMKT